MALDLGRQDTGAGSVSEVYELFPSPSLFFWSVCFAYSPLAQLQPTCILLAHFLRLNSAHCMTVQSSSQQFLSHLAHSLCAAERHAAHNFYLCAHPSFSPPLPLPRDTSRHGDAQSPHALTCADAFTTRLLCSYSPIIQRHNTSTRPNIGPDTPSCFDAHHSIALNYTGKMAWSY